MDATMKRLSDSEMDRLKVHRSELRAELHEHNRCGRCQGRGEIVAFQYNRGGVCFECDGSGVSGRGRGRAAKYRQAMAELTAIEETLAAHNAWCDAHPCEYPDPDTIDISALLASLDTE